MTLPRALAPFLNFAQALRAAGHLAAPELRCPMETHADTHA